MTLPLDLILVRHGQSEGNAAKRLSEKGDHSAYSETFLKRHSGSYRLTALGREQAIKTGLWMRENLCNETGFDRYYTSEYIRAKETAGLLNLSNAEWLTDPYLTERDWGDIDIVPENERQQRFGSALEMREIEPFFWRPPNGESFMELCLRIDRVLDTFHRECSDMRVIVVCHGEVMRAIQIRLERLSQQRFRELILSSKPEDRIHNCEVIHYTRRNPFPKKELRPFYRWVRKCRPSEKEPWFSSWREIQRRRYSNDELLSEVDQYPRFLE